VPARAFRCRRTLTNAKPVAATAAMKIHVIMLASLRRTSAEKGKHRTRCGGRGGSAQREPSLHTTTRRHPGGTRRSDGGTVAGMTISSEPHLFRRTRAAGAGTSPAR
jgi:hypothetical protein